jgi:hypothetical protein
MCETQNQTQHLNLQAEKEHRAMPFGSVHDTSLMSVMCCRIEGHQGVALDDLVYIMTQLARQAEADGFDKVFDAAEAATKAIEVSTIIFFPFLKVLMQCVLIMRCLTQQRQPQRPLRCVESLFVHVLTVANYSLKTV